MGGGKGRLFEAGRVLYFNFVMRLALTLVRGTALGYREGQGWAGLGTGPLARVLREGPMLPSLRGPRAGLCQGVPRQWGRGVQPSTIKVSQDERELLQRGADKREKGTMYRQRVSASAWSGLGALVARGSSFDEITDVSLSQGRKREVKGTEREDRLAKRGRALQSNIKHRTTSYSPRSQTPGKATMDGEHELANPRTEPYSVWRLGQGWD